MEPWLDFFIIIGLQLLLLLFIAFQKRAFREITPYLLAHIALQGIVFGVMFDLLIGKYAGVFDYALGFGPLFLIINGALSYGLWIATIFLLRPERFFRFYLSTISIGGLYEFANYFFPVWTWKFSSNFLSQEALVIFVAYCGLSLPTALLLSLTMKARFRALSLK